MTQLIINTGSGPDASDGDSLYVAFTKINENFSNVWAQGPVDSNIVIQNNNIVSTDVNGNIVLLPNGIGYVQLNNNTIPGANNAYFLGDHQRRWRGMYVGSAGINTTGNVYAGNLIITGESIYQGDVVFDGNVAVLKDFSTVGNIVGDSNLTIAGSLTSGPAAFAGNVAITGNLQVAGNIVYINVEELRVNDPIIELGTGINGAPLTSNDGYSRGILMDYYSDVANTQQYGFMGLAGPDYNTYQFLTNASDIGNVFTGTPANLSFGNAYATGELSTTGNVIGGNITTAGNVNALSNINGANLNTGGNISAEGTIVGDTLYANTAIQSGNSISAAGNITGAYILGNGAFLTGIDTTLISNGTSLVKVVNNAGNIIANVNGNTIGLWTAEGYTVTGNIDTSGYYVGNGRYLTGVVADSIGNVLSSLSVSGNISTGNLNTAGVVSAAGNVIGDIVIANSGIVPVIDTGLISNTQSNTSVSITDGNIAFSANGLSNVASITNNGLYVNGIISSTGNASVNGILTDNYYYANGAPVDFQQPAGANTWVQYNDNNNFGASAAFTFDSAANALAVSGNVDAGNLRTTGVVTASGNIIGGNLRTTGAIVGNTGAFLSDVTIYGNLQVSGNIVYVDVTELRVQDPIIEMGGGPNGTPLTSNDGYSRGLKLDYFDTAANASQFGFVGLAGPNYTTYQFLTNAVETDNTFSGTAANLYFGNAEATGNIAANGILTDNYYYANGAPVDWQQPAGANTWIQFNDNNDFGASANLTFDNSTNILSVGGNIVGANILTNGIISAQGNGSFGNISTSGNIDANIINVSTANVGSISVGNISLSGNITAEAIVANLYISANGNITGANLLTNGQVSALGNIVTDSEVTAIGNITGANINTSGVVTAIGNITGANINTSGVVSATGNIITSGIVTATGNVIGSNLITNGEVTASGNVTGSNLVTSGLATVTGNVVGGNLLTNGLISSTGNLTSGNINTTGLVTASGNITGANIITSGIVTATGNGTFGNISTAGSAEVGSILTDNYYYANGAPVDFQQPAGSNTWIQFNNNNDFGASANLTFDNNTNELYVGGIVSVSGNITGANIAGSNLLTAGLISATGNITTASNVAGITFLGNVEGTYSSLTANVTAGNLLTTGVVSSTGNLIAGNIDTLGHLGAGPADFTGDVNIVGNLTVDGNVTYIDVKDLRVEDPIITLGSGPNGTPLTTSDGFSRGLKLEYFNTGANVDQFGFFGLAASDYNTYQFLTNATDVGNTFTGIAANIYFGNAEVTGLITVVGNIDAGNFNTSGLISASGNLTSGNIISLGNAVISGNAVVDGILTDNYYYANGAPVDWQQPAGSNTWVQYNDNNDFGASAAFTFDSLANVLAVTGNVSATANVNAGNLNATGNASVSGIKTDNYMYANGAPVDFEHPAGANTWIQFNDNNDFGASANLTFDSTTNDFYVGGQGSFVGNVIGANLFTSGRVSATGNIDGGNLSGEFIIGTLSTNAQPNITSVGTLISLNVNGNVDAGNLRSVGTVTATGNIVGSNILTSGIVSATGNITSAANLSAANILTSGIVSAAGNAQVGGILTDNYYYANGSPVDFQQPAGSNTWVQYNDNNNFGASAAFTFDSTSNVLAVGGNVVGGNINTFGVVSALGNVIGNNLLTSGIISATGNIISTANVTAVTFKGNVEGTYANLSANVNAGNLLTTGIISATGNIISAANVNASNLLTGGIVSAAGNIISAANVNAGNLLTSGVVSATGDIISAANVAAVTFTGNVEGTYANLSANVDAGNLLTSGVVSATGDLWAGNISSLGDVSTETLQTTGNAIVGGDLVVNGNVTYINITELNVQDPIISMGRGPNDSPLVANDGKDRGEALWYYKDSENLAFIGWLNASNVLVAATSASVSNNIVTINEYGKFQAGNVLAQTLSLSGNITSSNLLVNGIISATGNIISNANVTAVTFKGNVEGTYANLSANVNAGNLLTSGIVSATGDITSNTNVNAGNLLTSGIVSATGNIISAANVTAVAFKGNVESTTISASANVNAGNLLTSGVVSATGDIISAANVNAVTFNGNVLGTYANLSANVDAGNLLTSGVVSAAGTVTGTLFNGNVSGSYASLSANVTGGNLLTAGLISSAGNLTSGNIVTTGQANLGNIRIAGDNITDTNGRVNFNTALGDVDFAVNGTVANVFYIDAGTNTISIGNATQIAGATLAINATDSALVPTGNTLQRPTGVLGMVRYNTTLDTFEFYTEANGWTAGGGSVTSTITSQTFTADGVTEVYSLTHPSTTNDAIVSINGVVQTPMSAYSLINTTLTFTEPPDAGDTIEVRAITTGTTVRAITNSTGNASVSVNDAAAQVNFVGNLIPDANVTYNLGSADYQWNDLYLSGNTIYIGGNSLSVSSGNLTFNGNISGQYIYGNGAFLTGISGGNAALAGNLAGNLEGNGFGANAFTFVSATGNITGGNITTAGNVTGAYILGNAAFMSGIPASYGNANVAANLAALGSNPVSTTGNITSGNLNTSGIVTATGNVTGGNLRTGGLISATGNLTSGNISTGIISASGNVTAQNFIGNISITGNVTGTSANVQLVAGAYTSTFDNTGNVSLANGTVSLTTLSAAGNITGANIIAGGNIVTQGGGVINKASGFVNAGTFVTLDNIKATVTTSGNRGLSLATVSGTAAVYIGGNYSLISGSPSGTAGSLSLSTTATSSVFSWNFANQGDTSTYILNDTTNTRAYRITLQIGGSYNNNLISIERL